MSVVEDSITLQVGVKALIQDHQGKYLFLKRVESFDGLSDQIWDIPGGRVDPHEALEVALAREIKEETGLSLESIQRIIGAQDIFVTQKGLHVVRLTYVVTAVGAVELSPEHSEHAWLVLDMLPETLDPYIRELLAELKGVQ